MKKMNSFSADNFSHFPPSHCLPIPPWGLKCWQKFTFFLGIMFMCICRFWFQALSEQLKQEDFKLPVFPEFLPGKMFFFSLSLQIPEPICSTGKIKAWLWQQSSKIPCQVSYRSLVCLCLAFDRIWQSTEFLTKAGLKFKVTLKSSHN